MSILGQEQITLYRPGVGGRGSDGRWVDGELVATLIYGSVQPSDGDDLQLLPEGERTKRGCKVYTEVAVRSADLAAGTSADRIAIDGDLWKVMHVERQRSILPHYKAIVVALQEGEIESMVPPSAPVADGTLLQRVVELEARAVPTDWWTDLAEFDLVEGQADYLFAAGADADTVASHAVVQWGATTLVPGLDYEVLADRLRLTAVATAEQAAGGEPLVIRFRRL